jgi:hypothetical protein
LTLWFVQAAAAISTIRAEAQEHHSMRRTRLVIASAVLAVALAASAQAQTSTPKSGAEPSTADKVKTWSNKRWNAAKLEWQKDKAKWDVCNQRATAQKLSGRKSWSFIYDCMKS